jgi:hypothetical protein
MKKILPIILLACTGLFNSTCKKKDKLTEFDINYTTNLTIPATSYTVDVPADFTTPEIPTESNNKFSAQNTAQNLIDEIKMTKFDISVSSGNLNGLKSISIYLKTSSLGEVLIATKTTVPQNVMLTSADLKDVNIKNYIFSDKIQFRVNLTITTGAGTVQPLKMDQTVRVKAKLLN